MADDAMEAAKKLLAEERKIREKSAQEYAERSKGKPTPTQEELDLTKLGATFSKHEEDGSNPDPAGGPQDEEKALAKSREEYAKAMAAGPPVPSQAELDKAMLGAGQVETRHMEAAAAPKPQTYQTRQVRAESKSE